MTQDVFTANLVVEHIEAVSGLRLRLTIELSLKDPDPSRCLQALANHLHLAIFESTPEVRVLSSTGITRLHRSYDPVRLPPMPPPKATLRPLPSHQTGLPRLPEPPFRRAAPTTPADQAGAHVDCFPAHAAFPKWQEGRHPHCHFRGLLRLYSRYGPPDRSAAHRRPLSRGSNPCGYPHKPLVSYRINRQLSGSNSSSTDDSRLRGALPGPDSCGAAKAVWLFARPSPAHQQWSKHHEVRRRH